MSEFLNNKGNILFLVLAGFFVTNAVVAEFMGVKIFSLEQTLGFEAMNWTILGIENLGFNLSAGVLLWPIVFLMTDIINEYYGKKGVRLLSFVTAALILYAFCMIYFSIYISPNVWWQYESGLLIADESLRVADMDLAFRRILGQGLWIIVGSLIAFLVGQFVDVLVFHTIKERTGERKIWLRATGSTLVSQLVDSFVVLFVAFYIGADWDIVRVLAIGVVNYSYKFIIAVIMTPLLYLVHYIIDRYLGKDLSSKMKTAAALG